MNNSTCKDCRYFMQHYILDEQRLTWINCGHCKHSRLKKKTPSSRTCAYFIPKPESTDVLITKHYLTKRLLDYILSLELPPEVIKK